MKVAFVGGYSVPNLGGIENYVFNMAKHLNALGWETVVYCRGPENGRKEIEGVRIVQMKSSPIEALSYLSLYLKASLSIARSKEKFDAVDFQHFFFSPAYYFILKLCKIKVFTTIHSFPVDNPKHGRLASAIMRMEWFVSRHCLGQVISVGDSVSRLILERLGRDSIVVHGGIDLPECNSETKGYYLYIGRIDPVKGLETLIDAFAMHDKDCSCRLVIVGDVRSAYGQSIVERGKCDNRIFFPGPAYGSQKNKWFSECDAFVLPSYSEGFPISLLEAMSYSKACIVSRIPANVEALTEQLGIWFEAGNPEQLFSAMRKMETGEIDRCVLGQKIRSRAESNFTWEKSANRLSEILMR